ncbi:MAG: response regulator transcription factor [Lachnospiraceae bacterium]|nr:response regulator transcription factor [Lachnospiraceae bacterium]
MERVLIVDDEKEIADLLGVYFENEGFEVSTAATVAEAWHKITSESISIALLDIMLPDGDGFSLCKKIREEYLFPVIMLTAKSEEMDKITGLTFGADDYVTKPFRPMEVVARVKAQLRRTNRYNRSQEHEEDSYMNDGLVLNVKAHECFVDGHLLNLTPTEFTILQYLYEHRGEVVSAEDLFHEIWKDEYFEKGTNTITTHIRHLREKMNDTEQPRYIKTVWGVGYKIER